MDQDIRHISLKIGGMTCMNCQNRIETVLNKTKGITKAVVSYAKGTAEVDFDASQILEREIERGIEDADYFVIRENEAAAVDKIDTEKKAGNNSERTVGLLVIIVALYVLLERTGVLNLLAPSQLAETNMGYGMLFIIGLVTSVHCVAMCGGINLSQCISQTGDTKDRGRFASLRPTFLYNLGRVISYTAVGFIVGGLGSVISFSAAAQGALKLIAGVFMIIMGVNMLGIFPGLRRLTPRMPRAFTQRVNLKKAKSNSPLVVGLLNGLMPCGPLQSMQIYALSTGSPFAGAFSMFLFSLGTVPLMFGLGALSTVLSKKFTKKVMTAGAVLVAVLGLSMFSQGWTLAGISTPQITAKAADNKKGSEVPAKIEDGQQVVNSTLLPRAFPAITVTKGTPVKWVIDAPKGSINGCNRSINIPEYDIQYQFKDGENVIEFTPDKTGEFQYSCWMGMVRSTITVVEPGTEIPKASEDGGNASDQTPKPAKVKIPADDLSVAEIRDDESSSKTQNVSISLTDDGFTPAILVVQKDIQVEWEIDNQSDREENSTLIVPVYNQKGGLSRGSNTLGLYPDEDFEFSNGDNTSYGYVKVVDDINHIDPDAIKNEVSQYETQLYPESWFAPASCCQ